MKPRISVIVPIYKVECYLRECIDSILNQTYKNYELILVDDGSPDSCGTICDEYAEKDERITVVHQKNLGVSAARNVGLDICSGEYVAFVDGDDILHHQAFEQHMKYLLEYNADISKSFPTLFSEKDEIDEIEYKESQTRVLTGRDACFELSEPKGWFYTVWDKIYKTSLFDGIRYPVGVRYEDEAILYKVFYKADSVVEIYDEMYFYRQDDHSFMHQKFSLGRYDKIKVFEERYHFFLERDEEELAMRAKKIADIYTAKYAITSRKLGLYANVKAEYRRTIWQALNVIKRECSEQNYEWWLNEVHPALLHVFIYWRKIKSILHIK